MKYWGVLSKVKISKLVTGDYGKRPKRSTVFCKCCVSGKLFSGFPKVFNFKFFYLRKKYMQCDIVIFNPISPIELFLDLPEKRQFSNASIAKDGLR